MPVWNTKCTNEKFYVTNIPVVSACETVFDGFSLENISIINSKCKLIAKNNGPGINLPSPKLK